MAFTLDLGAGFLRRGDEEVALRPKSFEVLAYVVERHGRLVTREELMSALWPDVAVTDEAVTKCIGDIRRALDDEAQQLIRTVARRGYLFAAPVASPAVPFPRQASRDGEAHPIPAPPMIRRTVDRRMWKAALLIMTGVAVGVLALRPGRNGRVTTQYTQITNFTDSAFSPALSPDGRMLAFIRGENLATIGGRGDIYVKLLPDGEPVRLTHDGTNKMSPVFTPGGDRIAYGVTGLMTDPQSWAIWTVPVFGGQPKLLLPNASALSWVPGVSPARVLFSEVDAGTHMQIVTSAENRIEGRTVYSPPGKFGMAHRSYLSPDRKQALIVEMNAGGWRPCRLVPFESAEPGKPVGPVQGQCSSAGWSPDGKWMYFSVNTGTGYHIWRQRFADGAPEQVTFGATEEREIAFDPDGRSFLTSVGIRQSTLWIHDETGERQITSEGYALLPRFSPDGGKFYYLLRSRADLRYVSGELWAVDLETGERERLLPDFVLADYSISPDGTSIAFVSISGDDETTPWVGRLDGRTAPRRLSTLRAYRIFFRAGGEIFFSGAERTESDSNQFVYRVREDGTALQKAIPDEAIYVYDVSPDASAVAAWTGSAVQIFHMDGSSPTTASAVCAAAGGENRGTTPPCASWSPDGRFLYVYNRRAGELYALGIPPGRTLPRLPDGGIRSAEDAIGMPGTRVIRDQYPFPGLHPSVYALFRLKEQHNIYRIHVP